MRLTVEFDREVDGRWIAEVGALPGVFVYGRTCEEALANVKALGCAVLSADAERGQRDPRTLLCVEFVAEGG